ncbi:8603_t:CDS:2 [Acaulospora morrowiae]|uniref:8603_t:CDS:1 n=1 Tax=Acaulospora morrowiae TaxID=94023 RepID=A0A9N8VYK6_9GLOM|nr:8603_t:CDS:2 [Acaulospora morrowiae]
MALTQSQIQQQSSTHMMKTTSWNFTLRLRQKEVITLKIATDIHDLYSTLVVSLPMETHRNLFRSYFNSFTTEEAIANLGSLKFTQSHRMPDPKDPSRIVTTTTTTTFSMTKDMAKSVCQTFMDARLFENLADSSSRTFKDKCFYGLTPKGLYILERFVTRNCISAPHLAKLFALQSAPIKLHIVERSPENDSLVLSSQNVESTFQRFAGKKPNDITNKYDDVDKETYLDETSGSSHERINRNHGIGVKDRTVNHKLYRHTFSGAAATDWLCDFSTLITKEEAVKMATEFLRCGWIELISDKSSDHKRKSDKPSLPTFKHSKSVYYRISESGSRFAMWNHDHSSQAYLSGTHTDGGNEKNVSLREMLSYHNIKNARNKNINSSRNGEKHHSDDGSGLSTMDSGTQVPGINGKILRRHRSQQSSTSDKDGLNYSSSKESNAKKLQQILEDPNLCSLFMDFSKANFCEENLMFLLDVKKFKKRYDTNAGENGRSLGLHEQERLISDAFRIYNTYLAPGSPNELNIDHGLRQHMIQYMTSIVTASKSPNTDPQNESDDTENTITGHLYDKIEDTIFRLLASDSVPKFIKTEKYLASQVRKSDVTGEEESIRSHKSSSSVSATEDSHGMLANEEL